MQSHKHEGPGELSQKFPITLAKVLENHLGKATTVLTHFPEFLRLSHHNIDDDWVDPFELHIFEVNEFQQTPQIRPPRSGNVIFPSEDHGSDLLLL